MLLNVSLPGGTPALLLLAGPDASPVQITLRHDADQVTGLTVREQRRPLSPHPTVRMKWRSVMPATGARLFRAGLLSLGRTAAGAAGDAAALQPVLCPFWPAVHLASEEDAGHFSTGLFAVWEPDGSRAAVVEGFPAVGYSFTLETLVAPLLQGRFEELPEPTAITDQAAVCSIIWQETGPLARALQVTAADAAAGPVLHGVAWPILPFATRYREARAGGVIVTVDRKRVGFGRDEAESHYPQVPARFLELRQQLTTAEAARVLKHWIARSATVGPFWAPAATSPCRLAVAAAAAATTITVTDAAALLGHAHIWLATPGGDQAARKIDGIVGNVVTLDAALGFDASPASTLVQPLLFVRFDRTELTLDWRGGESWAVTVGLRELPAEYGTPAGETHGTNLGPLAAVAWCYEITDGTQIWRRTSYAADLLVDGETFTAAQIKHGELKERINLDASEASVDLRDWPESPFARYRMERAPGPLTMTIYEGIPVAGELTAASVIWAGRVRGVKWDGPMLSLSVGGFGAQLNQPVPRWLLQPTCSSELFNPSACGLDRAQWTFTAARAHPQAAGYVQALSTFSWRSGAALPALTANYFAGGYIVRERAGAADQVIAILSSTAMVGLELTVTLAAALNPQPTALETWTLVPGCDGKLATCRVKFDNMTNFRGFASIPTTNPSINVRRKNNNGGKK